MSNSLINLDAIVGEQLSSVEFIQDYVQFHFDGPHIIAFVWPVVESGGEVLRFGETGYRDALCDRIGRKVRMASISEGDTATIEFDDGATIRISLKPEDHKGPEAILYRAGSKASDPLLEF
jgi:hypothetical protein